MLPSARVDEHSYLRAAIHSCQSLSFSRSTLPTNHAAGAQPLPLLELDVLSGVAALEALEAARVATCRDGLLRVVRETVTGRGELHSVVLPPVAYGSASEMLYLYAPPEPRIRSSVAPVVPQHTPPSLPTPLPSPRDAGATPHSGHSPPEHGAGVHPTASRDSVVSRLVEWVASFECDPPGYGSSTMLVTGAPKA